MTDQTIALPVLPKLLIPKVVHRAHGSILTGHWGVDKTKRRLLLCYYWLNMQQDIMELLAECPKCQLSDIMMFCITFPNVRNRTKESTWISMDL